MNLVLQCIILFLCFVFISASAHKYSTPIGKIQSSSTSISKTTPPPSPTNVHKKYVDFDLKSQSSRYGKDDPYFYHYHSGHDFHKEYDHYYPYIDPYHYSGKSFGHMIPYVLGGLGMLLLPLLTLLLTLAVNIAPASNIPTAVTTATGKILKSLNSTNILEDIVDKLDSAISKYGRLNDE